MFSTYPTVTSFYNGACFHHSSLRSFHSFPVAQMRWMMNLKLFGNDPNFQRMIRIRLFGVMRNALLMISLSLSV